MRRTRVQSGRAPGTAHHGCKPTVLRPEEVAYQAGTWVVDFTDPANAETVAWSHPPAAPVPPGTPFCCDVTGAWSTYWYNGELYETNIGEGLNIWKPLFDQGKPRHIRWLNPQTQDFSLKPRKRG